MSVVDTIKSTLLTSRKARDEKTVTSLSTLLAGVQGIGKSDSNRETTDEEAIVYLKKQVQILKDNIEIYTKNDKKEAISVAKFEIGLISQFLPAEASVEDVKAAVDFIVQAKNLPKIPASMGAIMAHLNEKFGNTLNKKIASSLAKEALSD